ncbi:hypothetical protein CHS0354_017295 [Potamilus streckersoni]|uniref:Uncharacterized protein n=1 Tax=Potamilus streckersoni TaxID=2493646 RepID=A0AAE0T4S7_9BIVA|nr:hypothetical protein CHS0354_017295 [Potamilus streckersoni]
MSVQPATSAQRVRRNVSPSASQTKGPIKAVKAFSLKGSSPTSPTPRSENKIRQRRSPILEVRHSPERRSPSSPSSAKVERPKARISPASSSLRRTGSLETIVPYLKGQWPADIAGLHHYQQSGIFMLDKCTQTVQEDLDSLASVHKQAKKKSSEKKKTHRRSASFGHGDQGQLAHFRQKLQKTKDHVGKQGKSPIPASHQALSLTAPPILIRSASIGISSTNHIPKSSMSRYQRNSVEGLNVEIEKLVHMSISEPEEPDRYHDVPDGHRAPVPAEIKTSGTRNVDTQTPSGVLDDNGSPASRPHSISPAIPIIVGQMDSSRPSSTVESNGSTPRDAENKSGDCDSSSSPEHSGPSKSNASPRPNKLVREPPDGCEKVKFIDENRRPPSIKEPLLFGIKPTHFVLKPSSSSAFCPLTKMFTSQDNLPLPQGSPSQFTTCQTTIEGQ